MTFLAPVLSAHSTCSQLSAVRVDAICRAFFKLNFLRQIYLHRLKSLSSQRFQLLSKNLCTHVDDWYLFAIGNYGESTTIERSRLRQLLLINGYKFLAQQLHPLLSKSLRTVSTLVWGKSRSIEIGCCLLLTITLSTKRNGFDSWLSLIWATPNKCHQKKRLLKHFNP